MRTFKRIGDIADIRSGYTFRGKIVELALPQANVHIAQIKDARKIWDEHLSEAITARQLPTIRWEGKASAFIAPGSVLLPARGDYYRASYLLAAAVLPVVASSQFLILNPSREVLPAFLCWILNQAHVQHQLEELSQGTNIAMLKLASVERLKVAIPSIDIQEKVLHLNQLWERERALTLSLLRNRGTMLQGVMQQLLAGKV